MSIIIGANFGYCVLAAVGISAQCFFAGVAVTGARKKYKVAYPDNGGGRYADKLSDEDWEAFNNVKRVSDNYTEQIGSVLTMLLMAGLFHPLLASSFGASYIVGRAVYAKGYTAAGPKGRVYGATISFVSYFAMMITAAYSAAMMTVFA
ncbi:hypothetical protein GGI04_003577 [Coemansia thaxteri]|uniref:Glutathione S-transferase n=1 Tax=Coemansia thaxteri TaxID=2663907 RepID=A0A9W8BI38_9FUNG|nr:hypothetical protein GGI04_003577 [Coemansia thaxteri]KAJ2002850.1 hypothetical protein H4R26_003385 [Coemansia thaxteri]KAJ2468862.1 hypothetical protein GGI02_003571 [Coemansia sp. RSA 2322]KAJ2483614.1 hypothetical protein EV174_002888 [Coemansia sp. RSA 2320]